MTLARLIAPGDVDTFLRDDWTRRPRHVPGDAGKWAGLLDDHELCNLVVELARDRPSELLLFRRGENRHELGPEFRARVVADAPTDLAGLGRSCPSGCTLHVRAAHAAHAGLGALAFELFRELGERVQVNTYFSPAGVAPGLGNHYDCWEVFVLQLAGRKRWTLFAGGERYPVRKHDFRAPDAAPGEVSQELELGPGDLLYLPRGQWHRAAATDEHSLHLTVGVLCKTGLDLLAWLARRLEGDERVRGNLLVPGPSDRAQGADAVAAGLARLLEEDGGYARFLEERFLEEYAEMAALPSSNGVEPAGRALRILPSTPLRWHPRAAYRWLGAWGVAVRGDQRLRLEGTSAAIWERFEGGASSEAVVGALAREFGAPAAQVRADSEPFVRALVERGLLVAADDRRTPGAAGA